MRPKNVKILKILNIDQLYDKLTIIKTNKQKKAIEVK